MVIRRSHESDANAIASLAARLGCTVSGREVSSLQASILLLPDHAVFLAEYERRRSAGWLHVFVSRRVVVSPFAELGGIVVDDAHRRSGIGSALLAKAEDWALRAGCLVLRIRSNAERVQADTFYRDCGVDLSKTQSLLFTELQVAANPSYRGGLESEVRSV